MKLDLFDWLYVILLSWMCPDAEQWALLFYFVFQGLIHHLLFMVTFYIHFTLVCIELILHVPADQQAIAAGHNRDLRDLGILQENIEVYTTETKLKLLTTEKVIVKASQLFKDHA